MRQADYQSLPDSDAVDLVANLFGVMPTEIEEVLKLDPDKRYVVWQVPKRDGGQRPIHCPVYALRDIQDSALKTHLSRKLVVHSSAHGGVIGSSITTNALPHLQSRSMFHLDLADAYGQVARIRQVQTVLGLGFLTSRTREQVESIVDGLFFAQVAKPRGARTYWGPQTQQRLPQGAPTSPAIFNHYCLDMDIDLTIFADRIGAVYTRYFDNIVFSWEKDVMPSGVVNTAKRIIQQQHRLVLNDNKQGCICRGNCPDRPLQLPGISIIDGTFRLSRGTIRRFRGQLYNALKSGDLASALGIRGHVLQVYGQNPPNQLAGLLDQIQQAKEEHHRR